MLNDKSLYDYLHRQNNIHALSEDPRQTRTARRKKTVFRYGHKRACREGINEALWMKLRKKKPTAEEFLDAVHADMRKECLDRAKRYRVDYVDWPFPFVFLYSFRNSFKTSLDSRRILIHSWSSRFFVIFLKSIHEPKIVSGNSKSMIVLSTSAREKNRKMARSPKTRFEPCSFGL